MIKNKRGVTLIVLIITIIVMLIIASTVITISMDRFQINDARKLINDLELLQEKVSSYYLKYESLPILRNSDGTAKKYTKALNFKTDSGDNGTYYIIDLEALGNISLNYGEEGFKNPDNSNDLYIINEKTHTIYYVRGIEFGGDAKYSIRINGSETDNIPPSSPEIRVISGAKDENGTYITSIKVEIVPGKDNWSGVSDTTYSVNNGASKTIYSSVIYEIVESGTYTFKAQTKDKSGNSSEATLTVKTNITHKWNEGEVITAATCTEKGTIKYTCVSCGITLDGEVGALGHNYTNASLDHKKSAATCTTPAVYYKTCSRCGVKGTDTFNYGSALGHNYVNKVSSTYLKSEATYTSPAVYYKSCSRCGAYGSGGTFTYGDPLSSGNTVGGGGDSESTCYNHTWQLDVNESYLCPHAHSATYECTNSGCSATKTEKEGHWPREHILYKDYFVCGCGAIIYFPSDSSWDTSTEWDNFSRNGRGGDYNGTYIWNNLWSEKCSCSTYIS